MPTRAEIIAEAREWIGTPVLSGQRTKGVAVDCLGLILTVSKNLGGADHDCLAFRAASYPGNIVETIAKFCKEAKQNIGCIQVMIFGRSARHIVIRTTETAILHAYTSGNIVLEHEVPPSWEGRFVATFDFPGVTDD